MGKLFCVTIMNGLDIKIVKLISIFHMLHYYVMLVGDKEGFGTKRV